MTSAPWQPEGISGGQLLCTGLGPGPHREPGGSRREQEAQPCEPLFSGEQRSVPVSTWPGVCPLLLCRSCRGERPLRLVRASSGLKQQRSSRTVRDEPRPGAQKDAQVAVPTSEELPFWWGSDGHYRLGSRGTLKERCPMRWGCSPLGVKAGGSEGVLLLRRGAPAQRSTPSQGGGGRVLQLRACAPAAEFLKEGEESTGWRTCEGQQAVREAIACVLRVRAS